MAEVRESELGSISVSGQLPTYHSPNPKLTLSCYQLTIIACYWVRGGVGGQLPRHWYWSVNFTTCIFVFFWSKSSQIQSHSTVHTFNIPTGENFAWSLPIPLTACILRSNSWRENKKMKMTSYKNSSDYNCVVSYLDPTKFNICLNVQSSAVV